MIKVNLLKTMAAALAIAAISFAGCGEDPAEPDKPGIVIDPEVALERTADADATTAGSVKFTTSAEWSSVIAPDTVTWLSIDPAEGSAAGTYTVNFVLKPNTAEDNRAATVTITAGGMSAKINVTQRGTAAVTETPEERKITFRVYGCEEQYAFGNGKEPHFLLGGVTVNVYKGTELVASPKTNSEGIAEAVLTDGVYSYVAVNDSVMPWSNIMRRPDAEPTVTGGVIIGIYNTDKPNYNPEEFYPKYLGDLKYRDINGNGTMDAQDYVAQVELPVTKDAEVDVYVAPWDFLPVYPLYYAAISTITRASEYESLIEATYWIDASLTQEYSAIADIAGYRLSPENTTLGNLWNDAYGMILYANTVLDLLPAVTGTGETDVTSEAYAHYYRAYAYYTLLNYFGGVPVTSLTSQNRFIPGAAPLSVSEPRSSEAEVEDQIIADCDFAAANASSWWYDTGSRETVLQLKARVLMRRGQHSAAIAVLREIIDAGRHSLTDISYWGSWGGDKMDNGIENPFLPDAMQKGKNPNDLYHRPLVYPVRYAETLLLYAEASLATGDVMTAAQIANQFADVAGMVPIFPNGGATQEAVNTEITRLWNTQLNMEAHTFARLKRTGAFPGALATYGAQEHHKVMPIPAAEIKKNPNLVQNPGY